MEAETLLIDTEENSPFFQVERLSVIQNVVKSFMTEMKRLSPDSNMKIVHRLIHSYFIFKEIFHEQGIQGITGTLIIHPCRLPASYLSTQEDIVFKISVNLDFGIEHENVVTLQLNQLRAYCPHFSGNLGLITIPVSEDFLREPENNILFKLTSSSMPCNILLTEYVSPIAFYYVCKYLYNEPKLIASQLSMILMALEIGQKKCKLCHYDLHLQNILMRGCEKDSYFLYVYPEGQLLIPTYGLYPVLIDMGSSYISDIEGKPMYTPVDNYQHGLQSTFYDNLNDVHHLLISTFDYLRDKSEQEIYYFLYIHFMQQFRHLPITCRQGWKKLPVNILETVLAKIESDCPVVKDFRFYKSYRREIVDIVNSLIILPWTRGEIDFSRYMTMFITEIEKIINCQQLDGVDSVLYILKETVDIINKHKDAYGAGLCCESSKIEWYALIRKVTRDDQLIVSLSYNNLFCSLIGIAECLASSYYESVQQHITMINEAYVKTNIHSPLEAVKIILQNCTPRIKMEKNNKIYVWDIVNETKSIIVADDKLVENVNNVSFFRKGEQILQYASC